MANNFLNEPSCKAHWRFEPGNLTTDSIGTNTLTNINTVTENTTSHIEGSGCADFTHTTHQYFKINDADLSSGFPLKSTTGRCPFTIIINFRPTNMLVGTGNVQWIFSKWETTTSKLCFGLSLEGSSSYTSPRLYFNVGYYDEDYEYVEYERGTILRTTLESNYFISFGYDGFGNIALACYNRTTSEWEYDHTNPWELRKPPILWNDAPLTIGNNHEATSTNFGGQIDDVIVFDRFLLFSEVENIKNGTFDSQSTKNVVVTRQALEVILDSSSFSVPDVVVTKQILEAVCSVNSSDTGVSVLKQALEVIYRSTPYFYKETEENTLSQGQFNNVLFGLSTHNLIRYPSGKEAIFLDSAISEEITLAVSGATEVVSGDFSLPFNTFYSKRRIQVFFDYATLVSCGFDSGGNNINGIRLRLGSEVPNIPLTNFKIRIQETSDTSYNTDFIPDGWTTVVDLSSFDFSGYSAGEWVFFSFLNTFSFTGENVYLDFSADMSSFSDYGNMYVLSPAIEHSVGFHSDSGTFPFDEYTPTTKNFVPSMKFTLPSTSSYVETGTHSSVPYDLSEKEVLYNSKIWWEGYTPTGTSITCETSITNESEQTNELLGTGDDIETSFELDYYPVSRLPITVFVNDIEVESGYSVEEKQIVFSLPIENGLSVKATYVGVDEPVTWSSVLKGGTIPDLTESSSLIGKHIWTRQTLSTTDSGLTPVLYSVSVFINYMEPHVNAVYANICMQTNTLSGDLELVPKSTLNIDYLTNTNTLDVLDVVTYLPGELYELNSLNQINTLQEVNLSPHFDLTVDNMAQVNTLFSLYDLVDSSINVYIGNQKVTQIFIGNIEVTAIY